MLVRSINHIFKLHGLWSLLCCFYSFTAFGQSIHRKEVGIQSDNDAYLFISQDQYYTNGIAFYLRGLRREKSIHIRQSKQIWEISVGHKLYNAYNGYAEYPNIDRPFTAYLFANGNHSWFYKNESLFRIGGELGIYGKGAFGRWLQEGFHQLLGFYKIQGWDYQLRGNVTLDLRSGYTKLLWRNKSKTMDIQGNARASLGLNQSYLGIGPTLRLGKINSLFESAATKSRLSATSKSPATERYFYYVPQLFYRFYDASIEGGMLLRDKGPITFGIKPWMLNQRIGFVYAKKRITLDAHVIFNTKEVRSRATAHQYASLALSYVL